MLILGMATLLHKPDVVVTAVVAIGVTVCELGRSEPVILGWLLGW